MEQITQNLLHYLHNFVKQSKRLCATLWQRRMGCFDNKGNVSDSRYNVVDLDKLTHIKLEL